MSKDDVDGEDEDENKDMIDARKELLHPIAIAQMMPQIFWSLVSHCRPSLDSGLNIQEYYFPVEDNSDNSYHTKTGLISNAMEDKEY